jgi:hypothetical protein
MKKISYSKFQIFLFTLTLIAISLACTLTDSLICGWEGGEWVAASNGGSGSCQPSDITGNSTTETETNGDSPEESIQQDEDNGEMEGVDEEESTTIPAGTYIGWMVVDLSMTNCAFEDLGNAVTIVVTDNGTVTGEISYKFTLTCIERESCIPIGETTYISVINGQLTETNNTIEIHETHSYRNIVRCNPPEDYTEENTFIGELKVSGDGMTCTIPGDGNRIYFEAKKQ